VVASSEFRTHTIQRPPVAMRFRDSGTSEPSSDPLNGTGSFLKTVDNSVVEYTTADYLVDQTDAIASDTDVLNVPFDTDDFVFDMFEIPERVDTNITSAVISMTVTADQSCTISIGSHSLGSGTFSTSTVTGGVQTAITFTSTDIGTTHSATFHPIKFNLSNTVSGNSVKISAVSLSITYTGRQNFVYSPESFDSIEHNVFNSGGTEIAYDGSIDTTASETDELKMTWSAGTFTNHPDVNNFSMVGCAIHENLSLMNGASTGTAPPYDADGPEFQKNGLLITSNAQYTATQGGASRGNLADDPDRLWIADTDPSASNNTGRIDLEPPRPNMLYDSTMGTWNKDLSTEIVLKVPYITTGYTGNKLSSNRAMAFEYRDVLTGSPTGNTGFEDEHGSQFSSGTFEFDGDPAIHPYRYRSQPLSQNFDVTLRWIFTPNLIAGPVTMSASFSQSQSASGVGVQHNMASADVGTISSAFEYNAIGGFLLTGTATPSTAFAQADTLAGLLLTPGVDTISSAFATTDVDAILFTTVRSQITAFAFSVPDVDPLLFVKPESATVSTAFAVTDNNLVGVVHGMSSGDVGTIASQFASTAAGQLLATAEATRTFTFDAETRSVKVKPQTRSIDVDQQTRNITVEPQTRTIDIDQQTRTLNIKGYID
jgi:hypothetical protein